MKRNNQYIQLDQKWMKGLSFGHICQIVSIKMTQKTGKSKKQYHRQTYKNFEF